MVTIQTENKFGPNFCSDFRMDRVKALEKLS
jgi:hypothetical protein